MKNTFKVIGIIAMVALIGFSMVSCSDDSSSGGGGGGGDFDSKIQGTWKGDDANGTLTITKDSFEGTPVGSSADSVASDILAKQMSAAGAMVSGAKISLTVKDGKIVYTINGNATTEYTYKVEDKTLTISRPEEDGGTEVFKGDKQ